MTSGLLPLALQQNPAKSGSAFKSKNLLLREQMKNELTPVEKGGENEWQSYVCSMCKHSLKVVGGFVGRTCIEDCMSVVFHQRQKL